MHHENTHNSIDQLIMQMSRLLILIFLDVFAHKRVHYSQCLVNILKGFMSLFMWEQIFTLDTLEFIKDVCFIYPENSWMIFIHCSCSSWLVHIWLLFLVFMSKPKQEDIKSMLVSKNITFYFQLQSETCNIFVTLLNKTVKNRADNKIHYRYTSKHGTHLAFKLT